MEDGETAIVVQEPESNAVPPETDKNDDTSEAKEAEEAVEAAAQVDTPDVPMRFAEKKRLVWTDKTCKCHQLCSALIRASHSSRSQILLL